MSEDFIKPDDQIQESSVNLSNLFDSLEVSKNQEALKLKSLQDEIFQTCYLDSSKYAKYYYPDRFTLPFEPGHLEIFKAVDAKVILPNGEIVPRYNKIVILSWRGCGKTSIAKTIFAKKLRTADSKFAVYVGKSHDFAALQTENIKNGMLTNKREIEHYGHIKTSSSLDIKKQFSLSSWVTNYGSLIWPRGCQQPVRGLNYDFEGKTYRVDLAVIDDLEDKEEIGSEIYRKKTKHWLLTDLCKAVPTPGVSLNWQIIYIDTLKHEDSAIKMLLEMDDWKALTLPLCDDNFVSKFPNFYTDAQCKQEYQNFASIGESDLFYQEFMCKSMSDKNAPFKASMFKRYREHENFFQDELKQGEIVNVILVDPAKTANPRNAQSSIVGVGINARKNRLYVRDIVSGYFIPDELYNEIFIMANKLRPCNVIGIETNSLEDFILNPFKSEMIRRGLFYQIETLDPKRSPAESMDKTHGKAGRVKGLIPYYNMGCVYHNEIVCAALETQLLSFPVSKLWDVMDCFAYIVQLMEKGNVFFGYNPEAFAGSDRIHRKRREDPEAEFTELEYEDRREYKKVCP